MKQFFALILILIASLSAPVGFVSAQDAGNATTSTTTPEGSAEADITVEINPATKITHFEFSEGTFMLTIESKIPARLTLTDSGQIAKAMVEGGETNAVSVQTKSVNVGRGETVVRMDTTTYGGMSAITVSSTNGGMVFLRSGRLDVAKPPVGYETAQAVAAGTAGAAALGTFLFVRRKRNEREMEVEREW